jgi:hypothetical protein
MIPPSNILKITHKKIGKERGTNKDVKNDHLLDLSVGVPPHQYSSKTKISNISKVRSLTL